MSNLTTKSIFNRWYTWPILALLAFGGYKLYTTVSNFEKNFDFSISVGGIKNFDWANKSLTLRVKIRIKNYTGIDINLRDTSVVAKSGGYLVGSTPVIPLIYVKDGTEQSFEYPFTLRLDSIATNAKSVLSSIDFHSKTYYKGLPINYTHTEDVAKYVNQVPGMIDQVRSLFSLFNRNNTLGFVAQKTKTIKNADHLAHLYPEASNVDIYEHKGEPEDTVSLILKNTKKYASQSTKISEYLKGKSVPETCKNLWEYYYNYFQYRKDEPGKEQVRTPRRSFANRKRGIDCDCFAQSIMCNLYNLGIPSKLRIIEQDNSGAYSHIYVVVPHNGSEIILDPVMDVFNQEPPKITNRKDFS